MKIGEKTLSEISGRVAGLMREHLSSINGVFGEEGEIKIAMPVKMKMENGKIKIEIGCSFVVEKLEDTSTTWVDESQLDLPLTPMRRCPVNKGESRTEKYCNEKCHLRYQVIFVHGNGMPDIFGKGENHGTYSAETTLMQFRPCRAWSDDDTHAHIAEMLKWEPAAPAKVYNIDKNGKKSKKKAVN